MKNLKNQKGITLVALVITIIVLLILAGISLNLVAGEGGILGKASTAVTTNKQATIQEEIGIAMADLVEEFYEAKYVTNTTSAANVRAYITATGTGAPYGPTNKFTAGAYKFTVATDGAVAVYEGDGTNSIATGSLSEAGVISNVQLNS